MSKPRRPITMTFDENVIQYAAQRGANRSAIIARDLRRLANLYDLAMPSVTTAQALLLARAVKASAWAKGDPRPLLIGWLQAAGGPEANNLAAVVLRFEPVEAAALIDAAERAQVMAVEEVKNMRLDPAEVVRRVFRVHEAGKGE